MPVTDAVRESRSTQLRAIFERLEERGTPRAWLARQIGISRSRLWKYENGINPTPAWVVQQACVILGIPPTIVPLANQPSPHPHPVSAIATPPTPTRKEPPAKAVKRSRKISTNARTAVEPNAEKGADHGCPKTLPDPATSQFSDSPDSPDFPQSPQSPESPESPGPARTPSTTRTARTARTPRATQLQPVSVRRRRAPAGSAGEPDAPSLGDEHVAAPRA